MNENDKGDMLLALTSEERQALNYVLELCFNGPYYLGKNAMTSYQREVIKQIKAKLDP
jgi:hypothetical protein